MGVTRGYEIKRFIKIGEQLHINEIHKRILKEGTTIPKLKNRGTLMQSIKGISGIERVKLSHGDRGEWKRTY